VNESPNVASEKNGKRILSVCTAPDLAAGRAHTLRDGGHAVTTAANRWEAEQAIAAGEFDLLVLGHAVPSAEGIAIAEVFRKINRGAKVVVVAEGWFISVRADRVVQVNEGPHALLEAITTLIR
jgi:DNA-binding response OmpR family regulator